MISDVVLRASVCFIVSSVWIRMAGRTASCKCPSKRIIPFSRTLLLASAVEVNNGHDHLVVPQVLKSLESCLHHYNICLQLYNPARYPRRWGLAALEMGMALGAMADLVERVRTHP